MRPVHRLRARLGSVALALAAVALCALSAGAEPPAAIPDDARQRAEKSFEEFARKWMERAHELEAKARQRPSVAAGARQPVLTYRGYGDDYTVELRPTGHAVSPFVGLLRYTEHLYTCESAQPDRCTLASSAPVMEIFRYQDGRWDY
jgi:hypothetical protein